MGGFFNLICNEMSVTCQIYWLAQAGQGISLVNGHVTTRCDIVTKASVAFVVSKDPDVRFKCCISTDSEVQASIKHETKVKPIQACRVHSGALDELASQRSTGKYHIFVVVFQIRAHSPHVPSSHLASTSTEFSCHKNGKWRLTTIIFS